MFKLIALTLCAIAAVPGIALPHARRDLSTYDSADLGPYTDARSAGARGTVHQDTDKAVALASAVYNNGQYGGKPAELVNVATAAAVTATATADACPTAAATVTADECPTCTDPCSVDSSQGASTALGR